MACNLCEKNVDDFKEVKPNIYQCPWCKEYWEVIKGEEAMVRFSTDGYNFSIPVPTPILDEDKPVEKKQRRLGWILK